MKSNSLQVRLCSNWWQGCPLGVENCSVTSKEKLQRSLSVLYETGQGKLLLPESTISVVENKMGPMSMVIFLSQNISCSGNYFINLVLHCPLPTPTNRGELQEQIGNSIFFLLHSTETMFKVKACCKLMVFQKFGCFLKTVACRGKGHKNNYMAVYWLLHRICSGSPGVNFLSIQERRLRKAV